MAAVRAGNLETLQLLLAAGANVSARNEQGETTMDLAYDNIKAARDQAKFLKMISKGDLDAETRDAINVLQNAGDTDELIEALKAAGDKRGAELGGGPRTVEDETVESVEPELPDFSERAKSAGYQTAVEELQELLGCKARAISDDDENKHLNGCMSFHVPKEKGFAVLTNDHQRMLARGFYLFCYDEQLTGEKVRLALLPTTSRREVLLAWQTNGANYDLMPEDIVYWLDELEKEQPFELIGIGPDWCRGRFTTPIKNSRQLAKKMYEFCPDIVDQGVGTVAALAKELNKLQAFYFWWD
jgi:hypothetical protein